MINYRQPRTRELRVYAASDASDTAALVLKETRTLPIASSQDEILTIAFDRKSLAQGKAALAFGKYGNITSYEQSSDALLANGANTLATALSGARAELLAGVQGIQGVQTSVFAMQGASRADQIKLLSDQKALLDAQLLLQGSNANKDLLLQKQTLDAQLALLKVQQEMETTQRSGAINTSVADLKAQIALLQAQLELVQKQLELEKAKSGGGGS